MDNIVEPSFQRLDPDRKVLIPPLGRGPGLFYLFPEHGTGSFQLFQ